MQRKYICEIGKNFSKLQINTRKTEKIHRLDNILLMLKKFRDEINYLAKNEENSVMNLTKG